MPKIWDISIKTNDERPPLEDPKENNTNSDYVATQKEKDLISFISSRRTKMKSKRWLIDKNWNIYQKQFDAIYVPYRNWKTRSNIPLEHTVIEHFISETRHKKPKFSIKVANQGKESAVQLLRRVKDADWKKNWRDAQTKKDDYVCAIFWMSVMWCEFEVKWKVIEDMAFEWEKITFVKKLQKNSKINLKSLKLNWFYWDDRADNFEDAVDCIYEFEVPFETFQNFKYNTTYKNIKEIKGTQWTQDNVIIGKEYQWKTNVVNVTAYYNKEKDRTVLYANWETIIQDSPLLNPLKILPFSVRQFFYNPNNVSGRWVWELLLSTKSELNTLKECAIEGIKRSNNEIFATWWDLEFDWQELNFNNTLLKFNGALQWNFQQISWTPPNAALFNYIQALYTEVAYWVWIDITSIAWVKENTAYQTAVRQEMQSKVINNVLENRDEAYKRMWELYISMLQFFYPRKLARKLIPLKENEEWDFEVQEAELEYPKLELKGEKMTQDWLIKSKWDEYLEISPEIIRSDFVIEVETNYNQPTLLQSQRENLEARLDYVAKLEELAQTSEEVKNNMEQLMDEWKRLYNVPIDAWDINNDSVKKEKEKLMAMIRQLSWVWWQEEQWAVWWWTPPVWPWIQKTNAQNEQLDRWNILENKAPITSWAE